MIESRADAESRHPARSALLRFAARALDGYVERLDWRSAQAFGRRLGRTGRRFAARDRVRSLAHLAIAFPEATAGRREELSRASFEHFGAMLAECLWLRHRGESELGRHVTMVGWEHVVAARAENRPILVVTGHCGNWEMLAAALNARGLGMAVVARELDDPGLQALLVDFRARFGSRTIVRGTPGAARDLLRAVRGGGALGMLIDQDTKVEGVWVPFFGRPAYTPVGAADLARRWQAAVLPTFIERLADGSHLATIHPRLDPPAEPIAATAAMTAAIESQIRRVPDQWVWMHRRWRRQPPD